MTEEWASRLQAQLPAAPSGGIVEDDAHGMAEAGPDSTHAMTHVDPINPSGPAHGTMVYGKDHAVTLGQGDDLGPRLHPGSLFGQQELAPVKSRPGDESRKATCSGKTCSP